MPETPETEQPLNPVPEDSNLGPSKKPQSRRVEISAAFSGPLPPPALLAQYETIEKGFGARIVKMAEDEALHRRAQEERALTSDIEALKSDKIEIRVGQIFAFLIGMTAIIGGLYGVTHGAEIAGALISLTGIGSLVSAFLLGRNIKRS